MQLIISAWSLVYSCAYSSLPPQCSTFSSQLIGINWLTVTAALTKLVCLSVVFLFFVKSNVKNCCVIPLINWQNVDCIIPLMNWRNVGYIIPLMNWRNVGCIIPLMNWWIVTLFGFSNGATSSRDAQWYLYLCDIMVYTSDVRLCHKCWYGRYLRPNPIVYVFD